MKIKIIKGDIDKVSIAFCCVNENHAFDVWFKKASSGVLGKKTSFGKIEVGLSTKSKTKGGTSKWIIIV